MTHSFRNISRCVVLANNGLNINQLGCTSRFKQLKKKRKTLELFYKNSDSTCELRIIQGQNTEILPLSALKCPKNSKSQKEEQILQHSFKHFYGMGLNL